MQSPKTLALIVILKRFPVLLLMMLAAPASRGEAAEGLRSGIVVEELAGAPWDDAGLKPGDVLLSWRRGQVGGRFDSVFDWHLLVLEQAPREAIELTLQRDGETIVTEAPQGDWRAEVRTLMSPGELAIYRRGLELVELGRLEEGIRIWSGLADEMSSTRDASRARGLRFQIARAWFEARKWPNAQKAFIEVTESDDPTGALILQALAWAYFMDGQFESAQNLSDRALAIRRRSDPDSMQVADSLMRQGIIALDLGEKLARAARLMEGSLAILSRHAPTADLASTVMINLGRLEAKRGHLERAEDLYQRALANRLAWAPDSLAPSGVLNNLGILAMKRGDLDRATERLERSLAIRRRLVPGSLAEANCLNNLGNVARRQGKLDRAAEYHRQALEIRQRISPGTLRHASSLHNLGSVSLERGEADLAGRYFTRALAISREISPNSLKVATHLGRLGQVAVEQGDLARAGEIYGQVLGIHRRLVPQSSAEANTLYALARLHLMRAEPTSALPLLRQAVDALGGQMNRLGGSRGVQAGFRSHYGSLYRDAVAVSTRLGHTVEAFHILERSRARAFLAQLAERDLELADVPEELEAQRRRSAALYDKTQHRIARLDPQSQADEVETLHAELRALRRRHEDLTEKIIKASPKLGSLRYPKPLDVDATRSSLDPGTVLLTYSIGESESHLFVLSRDAELRALTLTVGEAELQADIETILRLQQPRVTPYLEPLHEAAGRLYRNLVQPAEPWIARGERLLVVPDGPLHLLPFALLVRDRASARGERQKQYLVEWKPVHSVLSSTVYAELRSRRKTSTDRGERPMLAAFGDPDYSIHGSGNDSSDEPASALGRPVDVQVRSAVHRGFDFRPLPYSRQEVTRIAELYPEGSAGVYLGADASEERAKAVGQGPRILHFATHGRYDHRIPLSSFLAFTMPEEWGEGRENGLLQAWEIFESVRIDADLVVLSACESGLGSELDGEGLIGLTRAFQFAGAQSVVATLWRVGDRASSELMVRFYRHLRGGKSKDQALRAAQLELIRGPLEVQGRGGRTVNRDLSLPFYWAAYQLNGDWQ